jgi:hypothetical protein
MKIYSDDPLVHYKNSTINPERSKAEIDGLLAEWQVKDILWHWDIPHNNVYLQFKIEETINSIPTSVIVRIVCPIIWDKERPRARPPRLEQINWRISMRAMWWFIKTHLEMAYVRQSEKTRAFLSYIAVSENRTAGDIIIDRLQKFKALETTFQNKEEEPRMTVIDPNGSIRENEQQ